MRARSEGRAVPSASDAQQEAWVASIPEEAAFSREEAALSAAVGSGAGDGLLGHALDCVSGDDPRDPAPLPKSAAAA